MTHEGDRTVPSHPQARSESLEKNSCKIPEPGQGRGSGTGLDGDGEARPHSQRGAPVAAGGGSTRATGRAEPGKKVPRVLAAKGPPWLGGGPGLMSPRGAERSGPTYILKLTPSGTSPHSRETETE